MSRHRRRTALDRFCSSFIRSRGLWMNDLLVSSHLRPKPNTKELGSPGKKAFKGRRSWFSIWFGSIFERNRSGLKVSGSVKWRSSRIIALQTQKFRVSSAYWKSELLQCTICLAQRSSLLWSFYHNEHHFYLQHAVHLIKKVTIISRLVNMSIQCSSKNLPSGAGGLNLRRPKRWRDSTTC